jgi:hypothetical protein
MSNISNTEMALREKRFLDLWRKFPTYRCQASRHILEDYLDREMLSIVGEDGAMVLESAFAICRPYLAERAPEYVPPAEPEPEKPKSNAIPELSFNNDYWNKERLKEKIRRETSVSHSVNRGSIPLPLEYTAEVLRKMTGAQWRELMADQRYGGLRAINDRIEGKS